MKAHTSLAPSPPLATDIRNHQWSVQFDERRKAVVVGRELPHRRFRLRHKETSWALPWVSGGCVEMVIHYFTTGFLCRKGLIRRKSSRPIDHAMRLHTRAPADVHLRHELSVIRIAE